MKCVTEKKCLKMAISVVSRAAYKSKKTSEVARAYLVLSLCGIKPLVKHNDKVNTMTMTMTQ